MLPQPPPLRPDQLSLAQDEANLRLLGILHYVMAGLYLLGIAFVALHGTVMILVFSGKIPTGTGPDASPAPREMMPEPFLAILVGFYILMGAILVALAAGNFLSGRFIGKRTNHTFSMVVAGINCLVFPFGTALGVFTLVVLNRPSVKFAYDAAV